MCPSPEMKSLDAIAFAKRLSPSQRADFYLLQDEHEQRLQSALSASASTVSQLSALLTDAVATRGRR